MKRLPRNQILLGDVREQLARLPEASVDCVITSPPYFRLRDYQHSGQLGHEPNVGAWVEALRGVLRELARVLKPTGSVWLNVGDAYSARPDVGAPPRSLLLGPERLALKLVEDGWLIRNKVVWAKTNPKPESVKGRLAGTWEVVYLLARGPRHFFDLDAIRVPYRSSSRRWETPPRGARGEGRFAPHPLGKNPGDVWSLGTSAFRGAHFATFPPSLVTRPLLASCPARVCRACGRPWQRDAVRRLGALAVRGEIRPGCPCRAPWQPGLILDPFLGSGTVALVADEHGRDWLGIELNADYAALAQARIDEAGRVDGDQRARAA